MIALCAVGIVAGYLLIVPGAFALILMMDKAFGTDHQHTWECAWMWPISLPLMVAILLVVVCWAPFRMLKVGKDAFVAEIEQGII